ncbi:MAG: YqaJ viral recombinase family protein, partial [Candidatus Acidiferrum sp.]
MSRQEFPRVIKVAVIKRATCDNGVTYCEPGKLPARKWQIDHVIADAIGGKLVIENAELICEICYGIKPTGHNASREDKTARSEKSTTIIFMAMVESGTEPRRWRMTGIEIIVPASRAAWLLLRKLSIGASEIAALLNRHPWMTPFELWAEKSDLAPPVKETLDMELGAHIESVALKFLSKRRPDWIVTPNVIGEGGNFFLDRRAGLSCTPDAFVTPSEARGLGVCQVKKVSARVFREKWCNG